MSNAWSGADPTQATDPGSYSLGLTGRANVDVSVTGLRIWAGASPGALAGRNGRLWSATGSQLAIVSLPTNLPTNGWTSYSFVTPVTVPAGTVVTGAYDTGGNYGEINHAFDADVISADGAITLLGGGNPGAPHGNGSFTTSVGIDPDHASGQNTFYGVDFVYTVLGTDVPTITSMTLSTQDATVTATIAATDPNGLAGASYRFDWGDGSTPTSGSSPTTQHTYAASGIYAVLGSVTNVAGQSDHISRPVQAQVRGFVPGEPTLIEQFAAYLAVAGLGTYAPNDVTGTIFLAALPEQPVQAIAVAQYGGPEADAKLGYDTPSIQVRVRGLDTDATDAARTAQRVYDVLHGLANTALPGGIWVVSCIGAQSGPTYIGRDMSGRHEYTVNFRLEIRNTAGARE